MIVIIVRFRLPPETRAAAQPEMEKLVRASRAEAGCLAYDFAEDVLEPGLIRVTECWTDRAALDAHMQAPHLAEWGALRKPLGITDRAFAMYEAEQVQPG